MRKKKDFKTVTSNSFIVSVCILGLFAFAVTGCDYKSSNTSSLLGKAILNFQRGLNSVRTVGITVTCDTDTPAISTKKISGKIKDTSSLVNIPNARVSTDTASSLVTLSDEAGSFSLAGIESTTTDVTVGVTATGYDTLSQKIKLTCQNSSVTILISKVTIAAAGVNAMTMDNSKLDDGNIQ